ncbi:MAG: hypothetical protein U0N62_05600 [Hydrogeniiclostridium sp.]
MKRTGKMRNRKKWISAFLSVVLLLSTPGMQAGATEASSETIEEPGQITGVEDAQEVPAEEPAPETPAEDPVSPSAGAPADQFAPLEPDPNLPANTPAELLPVRYPNPGSADLDDICSTVTLSDGQKVSLTDNAYGYYLGNGMYFFLSINSSNNYGVKSPDSPYDDGEVDELIDMAMQTGIVTPRMLCANPEELTVYQMYVGEDTAIVGAKYIASWYHDGRDNDGASFNQELGTDVGPGNDVLYDDGMIKRTSFVGEYTTDRVGLQDMQVFGYDASWEVDYEQYKFLFGAEPPLPPGWRYGTEEELKTAWLEANSVMYQVQDLGIPSVERELLESRLRLINYKLKNKPEDWSQEKWEAFQAARENAQRVSQKENATAEEYSIAREALDNAYADAVYEGSEEQIRSGKAGVTEEQKENYRNMVRDYLDKLRNPRSDEFKAVSGKFGVSGRKVDATATATETVGALYNVSQTRPATQENAQAIIDFSSKMVELFGEGWSALVGIFTKPLHPFAGDKINAGADYVVETNTAGVATVQQGILNKHTTSARVDQWLNENPGAIDGVNDIMVPEGVRQQNGGR